VLVAARGPAAGSEGRGLEACGAQRARDVRRVQDDPLQLPLDLPAVRHLRLHRLLPGENKGCTLVCKPGFLFREVSGSPDDIVASLKESGRLSYQVLG
jgi:hypothetical protein